MTVTEERTPRPAPLRSRSARRLGIGGILVITVVALSLFVAPPAMADHNVVCIESPYDGPPLPAGVEIGTALKCENLGHETSSASQTDTSLPADQSTGTAKPGFVQTERDRTDIADAVPAPKLQDRDSSSTEVVPAGRVQRQTSSARHGMSLIIVGMLFLLIARLGWSLKAHRRRKAVVHHGLAHLDPTA